jgi:hypothetical protein
MPGGRRGTAGGRGDAEKERGEVHRARLSLRAEEAGLRGGGAVRRRRGGSMETRRSRNQAAFREQPKARGVRPESSCL